MKSMNDQSSYQDTFREKVEMLKRLANRIVLELQYLNLPFARLYKMPQIKKMLCGSVKWHQVSPHISSDALCTPAKKHVGSINLQTCPMFFSDL